MAWSLLSLHSWCEGQEHPHNSCRSNNEAAVMPLTDLKLGNLLITMN